jgi:hypothetical protein
VTFSYIFMNESNGTGPLTGRTRTAAPNAH